MGQNHPIKTGGAPAGNPAAYGDIEAIRAMLDATDAGAIKAAGNAYTAASKKLAGIRDLVAHASKTLTGAWEDEAATAAQEALRKLRTTAAELTTVTGQMGATLDWYGGEILPWYVAHKPDTGFIKDGGDDDYAREYMQRLNHRIAEAWSRLPDSITAEPLGRKIGSDFAPFQETGGSATGQSSSASRPDALQGDGGAGGSGRPRATDAIAGDGQSSVGSTDQGHRTAPGTGSAVRPGSGGGTDLAGLGPGKPGSGSGVFGGPGGLGPGGLGSGAPLGGAPGSAGGSSGSPPALGPVPGQGGRLGPDARPGVVPGAGDVPQGGRIAGGPGGGGLGRSGASGPMSPLGGAGVGRGDRDERERTREFWLVEDEEMWESAGGVTPVIGGDPVTRAVVDDPAEFIDGAGETWGLEHTSQSVIAAPVIVGADPVRPQPIEPAGGQPSARGGSDSDASSTRDDMREEQGNEGPPVRLDAPADLRGE